MITDSRAPDVKGVRDELLEPNTILMLLLLADVLVHVNRFSRYLQTRNLIFATLARKFGKLVESMQHLAENDGPSFSEHAVQFLTVAKERMALARRLRGREDVLEEDEADRINRFRQQVKAPFMTALIEELQNALQINDPVFLAFDVFNVTTKYSFQERIEHVNVLAKYYGSSKTSKMGDSTITAPPNLSNEAVDEQTAKTFFTDFDNSVKREEDCRNKEIRMLVSSGKLKANQVESYKDDHPVALDKVYADLIVDKESYPDLVKLLKYALLITPSMANVERGFSVLTLLATKQRNRLSPRSIDRLMRLVLLGPNEFDDKTWEESVDRFKAFKERCIDL